jgi:NTE family protein
MNPFARNTPKVGLALSGGGLRGVAHIGVLQALEQEAIPIDMIAGTSAGAFMGACFAGSASMARLQEVIAGIGWRKIAGLFDLNLRSLGKGFISGQKIESILLSCIGDIEFEDLKIPLTVVAADCQTMEEVIISRGSVIEAVRSSISVPVIFTPVKWADRFLIDGGVVNPLPVDIVRNMGAEIVVAVNVLAVPEARKNEKSVETRVERKLAPSPAGRHSSCLKKRIDNMLRRGNGETRTLADYSNATESKIYAGSSQMDQKGPNIFNVLMNIIRATELQRMESAIKAADIVIAPDLSEMGTFALLKRDEAIRQGYMAAKAMLPQLQAIIHRPSPHVLTLAA